MTPADGPRAGEPEPSPAESVEGLRARLETVVDHANRGDKAALTELRKLLLEHPEIWRHMGNLSRLAEQAWIGLIAAGNQLVVESVRRQAAEMRSELAGPHPTAIEKLLVEQVVGTWLAAKYAEITAAETGGSPGQQTTRLKRAESSQKRYLAAIRQLTELRARMPSGMAPLNSLKVFKGATRRA